LSLARVAESRCWIWGRSMHRALHGADADAQFGGDLLGQKRRF
jgi:hypothetical protein